MNDIFHDTLSHLTVGEAGKQYEILRGQNLYLSLSLAFCLCLSLPLSCSAAILCKTSDPSFHWESDRLRAKMRIFAITVKCEAQVCVRGWNVNEEGSWCEK